MISYNRVTLDDREWMREKLKESNFRGSEYCFTNQYLWGNVFDMKAALVEECLCTVYNRKSYMLHDFPVGAGQTLKAMEALLQDDQEKGCTSIFRGIFEEQREWMEQNFPGKFFFTEKREEWDYLYLTDSLASLSGRKYHSKRNHIARFEEAGPWHYEEMTQGNIPQCREMYQNWLIQNQERLDASVQTEQEIVEGCFSQFKELGLQGGVLFRGDSVVAFTIGAPLNTDTFIVHIEKANTEIQGSYPMINREFVRHNMMDYQYVNREDDLGLEGLRKAKLSYRPELLLQKYEARYDSEKGPL